MNLKILIINRNTQKKKLQEYIWSEIFKIIQIFIQKPKKI